MSGRGRGRKRTAGRPKAVDKDQDAKDSGKTRKDQTDQHSESKR